MPARRRRLSAWIAPPATGEIGLLSRVARFALAGSLVAGVYLLVTLVLSQVVGLPFQVALVIGFATALGTHFSLQRFFVWVHHEEFALPLTTQAGRYLAISLTQYGVTALTTATLPQALGVSTEVVYLLVTLLITAVNFLLFRSHVFHAGEGPAITTAGAAGATDSQVRELQR